ncbi:MAG: hypothetical protein ACKVYV_03025 [Limisphaerales bacterium]
MNAETLRELIRKPPLAPFHIRMDNGRFHILGIPHISAVSVRETVRAATGPSPAAA